MPKRGAAKRLHVFGAIAVALLAGCSVFMQSETCAPDLACIPSITWDDAVYFEVGSRGAVIVASDTRVLGELESPPVEAANAEVLALTGVEPSDAVAIRAKPGVEVAPDITVDYLIFVRGGEFPAWLCPYYAAPPSDDPAPPPLPSECG